jgi:hypothetical protein
VPGQTNSWMDTIQTTSSPCIGDTINRSGSSTDDTPIDSNGEPIECSFPLWWLLAALAVGYVIKGRRS